MGADACYSAPPLKPALGLGSAAGIERTIDSLVQNRLWFPKISFEQQATACERFYGQRGRQRPMGPDLSESQELCAKADFGGCAAFC